MTEPTRPLFISHASGDKAFVNRLIKRLQDHGVERPWYDTFELPHGTEDIAESISAGVTGASALCLILSPRSAASHWVSFEVGVAQRERIPILVLLHDAAEGALSLARGHPQLVDVLNGGRRKVVDFTQDFEAAFLDFLDVIAPAAGLEPRVEQVLQAILYDEDPDAAELQMTFAALDPDRYVERLLELLPELREDARTRYRTGKALAYIGEAAIEPLFEFLLLSRTPEDKILEPPEIEPSGVSPDTGALTFAGQGFSDMLRWIRLSGGNRAWSAQLGAGASLVASAEHDPRMKRVIEKRLAEYLKAVINAVPRHRDAEIPADDWDRLRLAIQTVRDLGPTKNSEPWLIHQFVSQGLWVNSAPMAAYKLGNSVVDCLARFGTRDACERLLAIANTERAMRAVFFEHEYGVLAANPWDDCFVGFGNLAVDGLLQAYRDGDSSFAPYALVNLSRIRNQRAQAAVISFLEGTEWVEEVHHAADLIDGIGSAGDVHASTRVLELYLSGEFDPLVTSETWQHRVAGLAAAIGAAADDGLASEAATRLVQSASPPVQARLIHSICQRRLVTHYAAVEDWRRSAVSPYVRGRAAIGLAQAAKFRSPAPLFEQLESANEEIERPLIGIALSYLREPQAVDLIAEGLRSTFMTWNMDVHEEYAAALLTMDTPEARSAHRKWHRRI